jgi:hypothetical protein
MILAKFIANTTLLYKYNNVVTVAGLLDGSFETQSRVSKAQQSSIPTSPKIFTTSF